MHRNIWNRVKKDFTKPANTVETTEEVVAAQEEKVVAKPEAAPVKAPTESVSKEKETKEVKTAKPEASVDTTVTKEENTQQLPILEDSDFDKILVELENAMFDLNEEKMVEILTRLQGYQYCGTSLQNPLKTVVRKVKMSDYMSAVDKVTKLKEFLENNGNGDEKTC